MYNIFLNVYFSKQPYVYYIHPTSGVLVLDLQDYTIIQYIQNCTYNPWTCRQSDISWIGSTDIDFCLIWLPNIYRPSNTDIRFVFVYSVWRTPAKNIFKSFKVMQILYLIFALCRTKSGSLSYAIYSRNSEKKICSYVLPLYECYNDRKNRRRSRNRIVQRYRIIRLFTFFFHLQCLMTDIIIIHIYICIYLQIKQENKQ